jgi:multicomponent Na+:H+ antiporter subunit B
MSWFVGEKETAMRESMFFKTIAKFLFPAILLFSAFLFLRGHNAPGGGFIGGLLAAVSVALIALSFGMPLALRTFRVQTFALVRVGLLIAVASGFVSVLLKEDGQFFEGYWFDLDVPLFGELYLGSPVLFDLGVFLVVAGIGVNFVFTLMEE